MKTDVDMVVSAIAAVSPDDFKMIGDESVRTIAEGAGQRWENEQPQDDVAESTDFSDILLAIKDLAVTATAILGLIKALPSRERTPEQILEMTKEWDNPKKLQLIEKLLSEVASAQ